MISAGKAYNSQFRQYSSVSRVDSSGDPSCRRVSLWISFHKWLSRHLLILQACYVRWHRAGNCKIMMNSRFNWKHILYTKKIQREIIATMAADLFLSLAKKVSGTQIFSAKSPLSVIMSRDSSSSPLMLVYSASSVLSIDNECELNANLSSFQYWLRYIVIV